MKINKKIIAYMMVALTLITGCSSIKTNTANEAKNEKVLFKTVDTKGNEVDSTIFKDSKYTVVNIWGTFCPACQEELTDMGVVQQEYINKGVNVIGILVDAKDSEGNVLDNIIQDSEKFMSNANASYTNILLNTEIEELYLKDVQYIPYTLILDSKGSVVEKIDTVVTKDELGKKLDDILK